MYIVPTINDENPNWRIKVGINGTTGDVPKDCTIQIIKPDFIDGLIHCLIHIPALKKK